MFKVLTRSPADKTFWIADATLVGISRVLFRHAGRLGDAAPAWCGLGPDFHRPLGAELLHVLLRDPLALAAVLKDIAPDGASLFPANAADVIGVLQSRLTDGFLGSLEQSPETTPLGRLHPVRHRPDNRTVEQTDQPFPERLLVQRVFLTALLTRLWLRSENPGMLRLGDLAVAFHLASEDPDDRGPSLPEKIPDSLGGALAIVRTVWQIVGCLPEQDFELFWVQIVRHDWPEIWEFLLEKALSLPETRTFIERAVSEKNRRKVVDSLAVVWRWQSWWQTITGARELFLTALAAFRDFLALPVRMAEVLETLKLDALADFAAGAAHEINNPLAVIGGHAQLLLRDAKDPDTRRTLAMILAQVQRAHEMIADTRLFARPPHPRPAPVNVIELLETAVAELNPLAQEKGVHLVLAVGPQAEGPVVHADRNQLLIALEAVGKNAIEAAGNGGEVRFGWVNAPEEVVIEIADNGRGIPEEHRPHIFNPFYSARQAGRGLGMGLPKAWRIVRQHGGRIEVLSPPGGGAVFRIHLPSGNELAD
ncbi:MAG: HAMP domain-containing histidine kinase [Thermogutta sp.]|uniref:sensor histidine kinase n=1 Tax=Thermogutta sp. TaxID=1962930 RepID=UPI0019CA167A|nr:HAMP domain-containing sensor histidine kinase [Thermogutta sp.]MBC7352886.1 HAMP domain-containing histidine kinase [Thermogutta sp.]